MLKDLRFPPQTQDLIKFLEELYPDVFELDPAMVGTPEYWKKAGVLELIELIKVRTQ